MKIDSLHGGYHYGNDDCRCDECKAAHAANVKRFRAQRKARLDKDPSIVEHGKDSTYTNWLCRCQPCKTDHARKNRVRT